MSWYFGFLGDLFQRRKLVERYPSLAFTKLAWYFKNWERWSFSSKKNDKMIFFIAYGIPCLLITEKFLFSTFLEIRNTVFFLMEMLYLLITKKILFWTFRRWEIRSFLSQKMMEKWYLMMTEKSLFRTFGRWEIWSFFEIKGWWKHDIYLVFLSFLWYSRTWEIWFFVQWI